MLLVQAVPVVEFVQKLISVRWVCISSLKMKVDLLLLLSLVSVVVVALLEIRALYPQQ